MCQYLDCELTKTCKRRDDGVNISVKSYCQHRADTFASTNHSLVAHEMGEKPNKPKNAISFEGYEIMEMLLVGTIGSIISLLLVMFYRTRSGRESLPGLGLGRRKFKDWPRLVVTIILVVLVFSTVLAFYLRDGIEGANAAWALGGPIVGSLMGYWFGKPL